MQRDPVEGAAPSESTAVFVAYDDDAVYIAARLYDSAPDSILARLGRRDAGIHADEFTFYVDSYHDRRSGFYFALNAAGTLSDGVLYNDDWDDNTWDGVWEGRAAIDSAGWSVEMRIPYSQLRFSRAESYVWGVNFRRHIARRNEIAYLVLRPRTESGFVSRFADLVGIEGVRPRARVEVLPYATTRAQLGPHAAGDPFYDGSSYSSTVGADMRAGIGGGLTLSATVNPDFGQVEVDPAVVNLSDVETFFSEKRPFFIENASVFNFGFGGANNYWGFNWAGPDFFYTRRIGRPPQGALPSADYADMPPGATILGAAKLTGKVGGSWNVGALSALTQREMARVDSGGLRREFEVEPLSYYGVARVQKEFPQGRHGLGFMTTLAARDFDDPLQLAPLLLVRQQIAVVRRRKAALRRQAQVFERHVAGCRVDPALQRVLVFELADLRGDEPQHDFLSLRREAQRSEVARTLAVKLHEEPVDRSREQRLDDRLIAAGCDPGALEVAAARVQGHRHALGSVRQRRVDRIGISANQLARVVAAAFHGGAELFVAQVREARVVELQVGAPRSRQIADLRAVGGCDVVPELVQVRIGIAADARSPGAHMQHRRRRNRLLRGALRGLLQEPEGLCEHGVRAAHLAGDAQHRHA